MRRTTLRDIADYLSLSVSTVSRGLSGDILINASTRKRIAEASERLGYRRNMIASTLRSGRSRIVGVIVNEMITPYASQVLAGIQNVLHKEGYTAIIVNSNEDPERELENIRALERTPVDGIIVCMCYQRKNMSAFRKLISQKIPLVFFSGKPDNISASTVGVKIYEKAYFLLDHLLSTGRSRVVVARVPVSSEECRQILMACWDAHRKYKVEFDSNQVFSVEPDLDSAKKLAEKLIEEEVDFDAIFSSHDIIAVGMMNRLLRHGIKIPDDVAVVSLSGSKLAEMVYPTLTTIEPSLLEMGEVAARLLLDKIKIPDLPEKDVTVDARIRFRESSTNARTAGTDG